MEVGAVLELGVMVVADDIDVAIAEEVRDIDVFEIV